MGFKVEVEEAEEGCMMVFIIASKWVGKCAPWR